MRHAGLLRRTVDGRELHDRRTGHVGSRSRAALRLPVPAAFAELIERLVEASIAYLPRQFAAGVEAVQIFESFGAAIPKPFLEEWSLGPIRRIVEG